MNKQNLLLVEKLFWLEIQKDTLNTISREYELAWLKGKNSYDEGLAFKIKWDMKLIDVNKKLIEIRGILTGLSTSELKSLYDYYFVSDEEQKEIYLDIIQQIIDSQKKNKERK